MILGGILIFIMENNVYIKKERGYRMLKELAKCIGEYKKSSLLAPLFITGEVIMEVIIPVIMAFMIDNGIEKGDMSYVLKIGGLLILTTAISLMFGMLSGKNAAIASAGFAKNLRKKMFDTVQSYSFSNIDKFSTASIVTRLTTDVTNLQNSYQMIIRIAIRSPAMLIFSLIMSFLLNAKLALVFLGIIPVLAGGIFFISRHVHPIFEFVFKTYDKLNNVVGENLHGIRVVKSFVREDYETKKFKDVSETIYNNFVKAEKMLAFNSPLMQTCVYTAILLISWFGAKMIVADEMTTGQLMSFLTYIMQVLMSLMMLSMIFVMLTMSKASLKRVVEIIREETDVKNPESPVFEVNDGSIEFKNVNFGYNKNKMCLKDINIYIKSGETIGIIGGTGSAKSSFVQLIPRLYDVNSGEVTVGGKNVKDYDLTTLRDSVAMVLQKNELFSGTIKDNLRWGNENATDEDMRHACVLAQADEFIKKFPDGYDTKIEQGGTNVSGGQKQRLCIARALMKKPKILILDDSTSAVDTKTDSLIRKAFKEEIPDTTKIIIAQRISSVQDADKIIVLDNGAVNGFGTHEELLNTNEIYKEVYYSQVKGGDEDGRA